MHQDVFSKINAFLHQLKTALFKFSSAPAIGEKRPPAPDVHCVPFGRVTTFFGRVNIITDPTHHL